MAKLLLDELKSPDKAKQDKAAAEVNEACAIFHLVDLTLYMEAKKEQLQQYNAIPEEKRTWIENGCIKSISKEIPTLEQQIALLEQGAPLKTDAERIRDMSQEVYFRLQNAEQHEARISKDSEEFRFGMSSLYCIHTKLICRRNTAVKAYTLEINPNLHPNEREERAPLVAKVISRLYAEWKAKGFECSEW